MKKYFYVITLCWNEGRNSHQGTFSGVTDVNHGSSA